MTDEQLAAFPAPPDADELRRREGIRTSAGTAGEKIRAKTDEKEAHDAS